MGQCVVNLVGVSCVYANVVCKWVCRYNTPIYTLPHKKDFTANIYVFALVTEQYTKCSNTVFVLLKMGIMMPETC